MMFNHGRSRKVCYDDFLELSVEELMFYLRQRGHNITGSKRNLVARALVSFENKEKPLKDDNLQEIIEKEYNAILEFNYIADLLEVTSGWENDLKSWPSVDLGKMFHYILENKAFDTDYVGQYSWTLDGLFIFQKWICFTKVGWDQQG